MQITYDDLAELARICARLSQKLFLKLWQWSCGIWRVNINREQNWIADGYQISASRHEQSTSFRSFVLIFDASLVETGNKAEYHDKRRQHDNRRGQEGRV
jgi:hypothetical protein